MTTKQSFNRVKKRNNEYIKDFLSGYINYYRISLLQSGSDKQQYKNYKIKAMLVYLGLPEKYAHCISLFSPLIIPVEFSVSIIIICCKYIASVLCTIMTRKEMPKEKILMLALDTPFFKLDNVIKCYPQKDDIIAVKIPFVKNDIPNETYSLYSVLRIRDCIRAVNLSIHLMIYLFKRYHKNDFLFRAYSAYEFFLSCMYVERIDKSNRFLYISTNDRWAYLFGNDSMHRNIFIQHGLGGSVHLCKYRAPYVAYYINSQEQEFFENKVFIGKPKEIFFRPCITFTSSEKLRRNGKSNLLVICCNYYLEQEKTMIQQLSSTNHYNIYIKPHPGFKDHRDYYDLQKKYDIIVLDKEDYPHVDRVLSYDSALATEYEDAGISVLRYNDTNFDERFRLMINKE